MIRRPPRSTLFPTRRSSDLKIAEDAGAVAVMALERVPADIRAAGGVARMSDPAMIEGIMNAVTIQIGRAHSELQSQFHLVCRLLLEKKKNKHHKKPTNQKLK